MICQKQKTPQVIINNGVQLTHQKTQKQTILVA